MELEKIVNDKKDVSAAEKEIQNIASELGIHLMTNNDLAEFTQRKDREYRDKLKRGDL